MFKKVFFLLSEHGKEDNRTITQCEKSMHNNETTLILIYITEISPTPRAIAFMVGSKNSIFEKGSNSMREFKCFSAIASIWASFRLPVGYNAPHYAHLPHADLLKIITKKHESNL